jgi:hypothetical protein
MKRKARFPQTLSDQKQKNTTILEAMPENCRNNIKVGDAVTVLPSNRISGDNHFLTSNLRKQLWFFDYHRIRK